MPEETAEELALVSPLPCRGGRGEDRANRWQQGKEEDLVSVLPCMGSMKEDRVNW